MEQLYYETDYPEGFDDDPWLLRLVGPIVLLGHQDKLHQHRRSNDNHRDALQNRRGCGFSG